MARQDIIVRIQEEHLTCSICISLFEMPKTLPCLHTFCEVCLRKYVRSQSNKGLGHFQCPLCNSKTRVPGIGVRAFPDNHLLKSLQDTLVSLTEDQLNVDNTTSNESSSSDALKSEENASIVKTAKEPTPKCTSCTASLVRKFKLLPNLEFPCNFAVGPNHEILIAGSQGVRVFSKYGLLQRIFDTKDPVKGIAASPQCTVLVVTGAIPEYVIKDYTITGEIVRESEPFQVDDDPRGIAVSNENYVVVVTSRKVRVFSPELELLRSFVLIMHCGITSCSFSPDGHILVSDWKNSCIKMFTMAGACENIIARVGEKSGQVRGPVGVCADSYGNILVAEHMNTCVQAFNSDGGHMCYLVKRVDRIGKGVSPIGLALGPNNTLVLIVSGPRFGAEVLFYEMTVKCSDHVDS